ncbi:hypothetical protein J6590_104234 [Homalodisca vitripennis]|nr:hypothetical protein J6590_104234 [Homalodisca vitripennis]
MDGRRNAETDVKQRSFIAGEFGPTWRAFTEERRGGRKPEPLTSQCHGPPGSRSRSRSFDRIDSRCYLPDCFDETLRNTVYVESMSRSCYSVWLRNVEVHTTAVTPERDWRESADFHSTFAAYCTWPTASWLL